MNWTPSVRPEEGMEQTYRWIYDEMTSSRTTVVNALPNAVVAR
jgi:hypothetical protein